MIEKWLFIAYILFCVVQTTLYLMTRFGIWLDEREDARRRNHAHRIRR